MSSSLTVRPARVEDVAEMARVNVRCWQETYRGLVSDAVLDDPGFVAARERFWTAAVTDERYRENRAAVAERDGEMLGIAMSGPPLDAGAAWARQLYVLYVLAADHGTGAGPALLAAVVDPEESVALWVADPNPRAQAFYRKHGFVADGTAQLEGGVREIRMVRGEQQRIIDRVRRGDVMQPQPPDLELETWQWLVGSWAIEATHPGLPDTVVSGTATFEWLEDQQFLIHRTHYDHPQLPDAVAVIGVVDGEPSMHYFDVRGVHRTFSVAIAADAWRYWNDTPGFAQRFTGTRSDDGSAIDGRGELSRDGATWDDDLTITYRRVG